MKNKLLGALTCPFEKFHFNTTSIGGKPKLRLHGMFQRKNKGAVVKRYRCLDCARTFSDATLTFEYRQRKRDINLPLFKLMASNITQRRAAKVLNVARRTVESRLPYFDKVARAHHKILLETRDKSTQVHFDDMETSEHTKLKPLSIPIAVDHSSRIILGYDVAQMPAKGKTAAISRAKYGPRSDLRHLGWANVLTSVASTSISEVEITSDSHKRYPEMIHKYVPGAKHVQVKSRRACVAGQGELKLGGFDPIFSINHTAAMLRANMSRLIRRTWCTTKRAEKLRCHISLYVLWHNETILAKMEGRRVSFPF